MKRDKSFTWHRVDANDLDLSGKSIAVIGGTGGIGRALSRLLAARGARVTVIGQTFRDADVPRIDFIKADLSLMREAKRVATQLPVEKLDMVVFTTGIFAAPKRQETAEGIERDMAVSYLSRLVIVREIAERLGKDRTDTRTKPRVVIMGYPGTGQGGKLGDLNAERAYSAMTVHMNTVVGNEILVLDGAKRYPQVNFYGLNPGLIRTNIRSNFLGGKRLLSSVIEGLIGILSPSAETYAQRIVPLLVSPDLDAHSGKLFDRKAQSILPSPGLTDSHAKAFLSASDALVIRAASC